MKTYLPTVLLLLAGLGATFAASAAEDLAARQKRCFQAHARLMEKPGYESKRVLARTRISDECSLGVDRRTAWLSFPVVPEDCRPWAWPVPQALEPRQASSRFT